MTTETQAANTYVFGNSNTELQRLINQSKHFGELTEDVLRKAGIEPGMRVLDVGCGSGDVSFLLAKMVGTGGMVIGVDKSVEAVELARQRATAAMLTQVEFGVADITGDFQLAEPVDAIVGRFILMHVANPAGVLSRLVTNLKPGGLIVFQEMDGLSGRAVPESPLYKMSDYWMGETFRRAGFSPNAGSNLYNIFIQAGLAAPQMYVNAQVVAGPDSPGYEVMAGALRGLLPLIERLGVAKAEEIQIDTFAARLRDELVATNGILIAPSLIGAWTRNPL